MSHRSKARHDARRAATRPCKDCGCRVKVERIHYDRCGACFLRASTQTIIDETKARGP